MSSRSLETPSPRKIFESQGIPQPQSGQEMIYSYDGSDVIYTLEMLEASVSAFTGSEAEAQLERLRAQVEEADMVVRELHAANSIKSDAQKIECIKAQLKDGSENGLFNPNQKQSVMVYPAQVTQKAQVGSTTAQVSGEAIAAVRLMLGIVNRTSFTDSGAKHLFSSLSDFFSAYIRDSYRGGRGWKRTIIFTEDKNGSASKTGIRDGAANTTSASKRHCTSSRLDGVQSGTPINGNGVKPPGEFWWYNLTTSEIEQKLKDMNGGHVSQADIESYIRSTKDIEAVREMIEMIDDKSYTGMDPEQLFVPIRGFLEDYLRDTYPGKAGSKRKILFSD